jgi:hypothetical protein
MWPLDLSTASRIVICGQASTGIVLFLPYFEKRFERLCIELSVFFEGLLFFGRVCPTA